MVTPETILKQYWGYDTFRPLQNDIIASVLNNRDTLALLPTGGGKSVCYQVPAMVRDGLCLVVSPLIALMQDQVQRLTDIGIPAVSLHSGMNYKAVKDTLERAREGEYKLLYVSPERLQTYLFNDYLPTLDLNLVAIDEAHCISQWGHDFRPDYLKIATIRELFTSVPMLALTATATQEVQQDIALQLKLKNYELFKQSFARKNIFYQVNYTEKKNADMLNAISNECSIVYCRSRKLTELTGDYLLQNGIKAAVYHAGLKKEEREDAQEKWMKNEASVMVATTAFGMGIDKPDVRLVLHYDSPEHLEAWYQEAGRAGRDGAPSDALSMYNKVDIKRLEESTALQYPPEAYLRQVYQSVAEYLQIPIGAEPHHYYPFDVFDFCKKFSLVAIEALYALKLLERDGLWTLSEAVYQPSTVQFVADRHVVDSLGQSHEKLAYVAVGLLRMFNAIFYYPTAIRESAVAFRLKIKQPELIMAMEQLHRMGIIDYNKTGEGPQMFFHHRRADSQYLLIDLNRIAILRKRHQERTDKMIAFLRNTTTCREQFVLQYFGEADAQKCGHCDVCRNNNWKAFSVKDLTNDLLLQLAEGNRTLPQLTAHLTTMECERVTRIIREMIDEGALIIDANGGIRLLDAY